MMSNEEQTFGIPPNETATSDPGIPEDETGIPAGIPDEKTTTAKVKPSTKMVVTNLRIGDESFDDTIRRIFGVYHDLTSDLEHQKAVNKEIRNDLKVEQQRYLEKFDEQVHEIGGLRAQVATLTNQIETRLVPANEQTALDSFGIKDTVKEAREMCGDDDTCMKVAGKMMDLKAHFASKAMDHDHVAEQKRLDREQDELDRKLKKETAAKDREERAKDRELKKAMAETEQEHKRELQLLKKGIIKTSVLEDVAYTNISAVPKRPGKAIADKRKRAYHAAKDDDDDGSWLNDDPMDEETLDMPEEFDEDEI